MLSTAKGGGDNQMSSNAITTNPVVLNGFEVKLPETIGVIVKSMPDPRDVKAERERLAGWWFVHWYWGKLYCLRLKSGGPNIEGQPMHLEVREHPWLLRARLDDALPAVFDRYPAHRHRPFSFLSQREELVATAAEKANVQHPLLGAFG
jgi:hypothetical protein